MKSVRECGHETVSFQSGDYYVMCRDCGSMWGRLKPGQNEYGTLADGRPVGCSPEAANTGPSVCDQIRVAVKTQSEPSPDYGTRKAAPGGDASVSAGVADSSKAGANPAGSSHSNQYTPRPKFYRIQRRTDKHRFFDYEAELWDLIVVPQDNSSEGAK